MKYKRIPGFEKKKQSISKLQNSPKQTNTWDWIPKEKAEGVNKSPQSILLN